MEVHPPDHPVMSLKQFFIHMGIVVLGLLIALGLEQSVEAIHHHHERRELQEAMQRDLEQIEHDSEQTYVVLSEQRTWMQRTVEQGQADLMAHKPFQMTPQPTGHSFDTINDPAFTSARASGLLELLSQDDVRAFSEVDNIVVENQELFRQVAPTNARTQATMLRYGVPGGPTSHWDKASPEDLREFLNDSGSYIAMMTLVMMQNQQAYGASKAMLGGERDLQKIYNAEKRHIPGTN